jgi:hypothetical protein
MAGTREPTSMSLRTLWLIPLSALLLGCPPKIGKSCSLSTDCSQLGDRLCDTNQPDGYCTIFNCEPDNCPESICVGFDPSLDPACRSVDDGRWPRFQRSFCMAPCSSDGDCRDGYECIDLSVPRNQTSRRAEVVDLGAGDGGLGFSVCMAKGTSSLDGGVDAGPEPEPTDAGIPGVCKPVTSFPPDAGAPWPPYKGGAGGAGGSMP